MRLSAILLLSIALAALTGCDRANPPAEQAEGDVEASAAASNSREPIGLESASGMKAVLSYDFAGSPAPDVIFTGADGRGVTLGQFAGRPLLVNIWATWCAPCKKEMPTLDALAAIEADKISVIAISQDLQGRRPVRAFFDQSGIENLEPYVDRPNRISAAFDHRLKLPTTILYDSDGSEVWRAEGGLEWDDEEMASLLDEAS
ncbi:MAG: TlpA disulfide reductase family protein [Sphingorhabdus sp.]